MDRQTDDREIKMIDTVDVCERGGGGREMANISPFNCWLCQKRGKGGVQPSRPAAKLLPVKQPLEAKGREGIVNFFRSFVKEHHPSFPTLWNQVQKGNFFISPCAVDLPANERKRLDVCKHIARRNFGQSGLVDVFEYTNAALKARINFLGAFCILQLFKWKY